MRRLKFLSLFFLTAALLGVSAWRSPLPVHGAEALSRALVADLVLVLAALACGRGLLARLKLYHASLSEEAILSFSLGLVVLSFLGSALGAIGVLYAWSAWLGLGLILIIQWDHLEHFGRLLQRNLRVKHPWDGSSTEVLALVAGVLGLVALAGLCLAPVSAYEALSGPWASVQRAVEAGRDLPQAGNLFSWLPSLAQALWELSVLLSGNGQSSSLAPALLNAALALVLGLALVDAFSRWFSERRIWLAPALAWTQPFLILSFGLFCPDPWMCYFAFISLTCFLCALEVEAQDGARQGAWLGLSAFLAGAACAATPIAWTHAVALLPLVGWQCWRRPAWRRWQWALGAVALFLLPLTPWLLRGGFLRGQPFYPLGQIPYGELFSALRTAPFSWLLLGLAPAAWAWRYQPVQRAVALYVVLGALLWCLGPKEPRYALVLIPAACLWGAHGVMEVELWAASKGWTYAWRILVLMSLFLGAAQSLLVVTRDQDPWQAALGLQAPEDYLSEQGVPQAEAAAWIRSRPSARKRVLVLGDARTAYLPLESLAASPYDEQPFRAWAAEASSAQDLGAVVRRKGYDFVLLSRREWQRTEDPAAPFYWSRGDTATAQRVQAWLQALALEHQQLELSHGAGWVYDLKRRRPVTQSPSAPL
jgi:hypothetical protein